MAPATERLAELTPEELAEADAILRGAMTDRVLDALVHAVQDIRPEELDTMQRRQRVRGIAAHLTSLANWTP